MWLYIVCNNFIIGSTDITKIGYTERLINSLFQKYYWLSESLNFIPKSRQQNDPLFQEQVKSRLRKSISLYRALNLAMTNQFPGIAIASLVSHLKNHCLKRKKKAEQQQQNMINVSIWVLWMIQSLL